MHWPVTTCMSLTPQAAGPAPLLRRLFGLVRDAWRAYWEWRARRVAVMLLSSLDARTLKDIGISPGEIEAVVRCCGGHRRCCDAAWLWRCGWEP